MLFVVSGPSGCGKSTIIHHLVRDLRRARFSVSHTTRPKRPSEEEGRDYYFVTRPEFQRMIARRQFLEWAVVHGQYYGTSKKEASEKGKTVDLILDIDVQGARQIRSSGQRAIFIFILPPVYNELRRRLQERGEDSAEVIERRLKNARKEILEYVHFDHLVVNDTLDRAVLELESIILCARSRIDVRSPAIQPILKSFRT